MDRLKGKVAVVTGAASGLGRASAIMFSKEGAAVAVADVNERGAAETVTIIEGSGSRAFYVKADVSKADEAEALVKETVRRYGRLDCALNNAGIEGPAFLVGEYPEEEWDRVISVNQKGIMLCMRFEIEQMLRQGGGAIVNTSSGAGLRGLAYQSAYSTSKHAIIGLSRTAAVEYARKGIRVNVICPGFIDTGLTRLVIAKKPHLEEKYRKLVPMGRFGKEEEVAEAAVWLCSDASSFVTGHSLVIDGGASA
ncbi:MAG: 2,5-dichloro-2,5-cyclohexadiene-1,4-diol dehydrogenase [Syntrophorhabdaceae bacterium PtaU1.Bin034]|nr:MAG: 2,5-dichloro-2,5-cyclohexadiene-1,4-diol dehydrogenase [Syntrophorhabdaceae bacterium PtaU1.Bin034]